jgi:hypothetical protein
MVWPAYTRTWRLGALYEPRHFPQLEDGRSNKARLMDDQKFLPRVKGQGIMRTLQVEERPTSLARAIAEISRIDETIHTLNSIDDEARRRATLLQRNLGESRHSLARDVFTRQAWRIVPALPRRAG